MFHTNDDFSSLTIDEEGSGSRVFYEIFRKYYGSKLPSKVSYNGKVNLIDYEMRSSFSDFISGSDWILVNEKNKSLLSPHLKGYGVWIRMMYKSEILYYFRVENIVDALTEKCVYEEITPEYKRLVTPVFDFGIVESQLIFTIKEWPTCIFINESFKELVEKLDFSGSYLREMEIS